ncbi:unnamed protein product [Amoebophrya sp. A120]|nr:unnamed protein product [Amoebophrya sp. A120]|eukprot:GSA120T00008082001.1
MLSVSRTSGNLLERSRVHTLLLILVFVSLLCYGSVQLLQNESWYFGEGNLRLLKVERSVWKWDKGGTYLTALLSWTFLASTLLALLSVSRDGKWRQRVWCNPMVALPIAYLGVFFIWPYFSANTFWNQVLRMNTDNVFAWSESNKGYYALFRFFNTRSSEVHSANFWFTRATDQVTGDGTTGDSSYPNESVFDNLPAGRMTDFLRSICSDDENADSSSSRPGNKTNTDDHEAATFYHITVPQRTLYSAVSHFTRASSSEDLITSTPWRVSLAGSVVTDGSRGRDGASSASSSSADDFILFASTYAFVTDTGSHGFVQKLAQLRQVLFSDMQTLENLKIIKDDEGDNTTSHEVPDLNLPREETVDPAAGVDVLPPDNFLQNIQIRIVAFETSSRTKNSPSVIDEDGDGGGKNGNAGGSGTGAPASNSGKNNDADDQDHPKARADPMGIVIDLKKLAEDPLVKKFLNTNLPTDEEVVDTTSPRAGQGSNSTPSPSSGRQMSSGPPRRSAATVYRDRLADLKSFFCQELCTQSWSWAPQPMNDAIDVHRFYCWYASVSVEHRGDDEDSDSGTSNEDVENNTCLLLPRLDLHLRAVGPDLPGYINRVLIPGSKFHRLLTNVRPPVEKLTAWKSSSTATGGGGAAGAQNMLQLQGRSYEQAQRGRAVGVLGEAEASPRATSSGHNFRGESQESGFLQKEIGYAADLEDVVEPPPDEDITDVVALDDEWDDARAAAVSARGQQMAVGPSASTFRPATFASRGQVGEQEPRQPPQPYGSLPPEQASWSRQQGKAISSLQLVQAAETKNQMKVLSNDYDRTTDTRTPAEQEQDVRYNGLVLEPIKKAGSNKTTSSSKIDGGEKSAADAEDESQYSLASSTVKKVKYRTFFVNRHNVFSWYSLPDADPGPRARSVTGRLLDNEVSNTNISAHSWEYWLQRHLPSFSRVGAESYYLPRKNFDRRKDIQWYPRAYSHVASSGHVPSFSFKLLLFTVLIALVLMALFHLFLKIDPLWRCFHGRRA